MILNHCDKEDKMSNILKTKLIVLKYLAPNWLALAQTLKILTVFYLILIYFKGLINLLGLFYIYIYIYIYLYKNVYGL